MYKICIFAGTTEGRKLAEFLRKEKVQITVCVATEYGSELLPLSENLKILAGKMPKDEIVQMFRKTQFDLVIDATHPYASSITESIASACTECKTKYIRLLRESSEISRDFIFVNEIENAVDYLNQTEGNILLTTGSKELQKYTKISDFEERVYARVLPMQTSLEACEKAGLKPSHIIAMQGPFTQELNIAMLKSVKASYLVTKDGGSPGGFEEKAAAAEKTGTKLIVIGRPKQRQGMSYRETIDYLTEHLQLTCSPSVEIVGIGPGSRNVMTKEVSDAIKNADCLIGADRMLQAVKQEGQFLCNAIAADVIASFIREHPQFGHFTVVMSGDTGFFSGTKKLLPLLKDYDVQVLPGISSFSYLCAKLGKSYEESCMVSVHGRIHNIAADVSAHASVFALSGGKDGVNKICRDLLAAGLGKVQVFVGECLSYPEEKITIGTPEELLQQEFQPLTALLIENPCPEHIVTQGLPDEAFQRGGSTEGVVPMTKSEVRAVCLAKLQLTENAVCWDIGAGTGSVSIEMALQAKKGFVYAVEKKADAVALLKINKERFYTENLDIIEGSAPKACQELPAPSHVFIGGSSGNMQEIVKLALLKNPLVRIVATAVTLESAAELTDCMKDPVFSETEVVSMNIAKGRKIGSYHLMTGQNPIYIFTMKAGENK